jgi:hypothetical protein
VTVSTLCLPVVVALADSKIGVDKNTEQRVACMNNLRLIDLACRIWSADKGDKYPIHISQKQGSAMESANLRNVAPIFQVMSNELTSPKFLVCPADTNCFIADNFTTGFDNSYISYFVGLDADITFPQSLVAGDSNMAIDGVPVKSGLLQLSTDVPITWTADRHFNKGVNVGNVILSDAIIDIRIPLPKLLVQTGLATNRLAIP